MPDRVFIARLFLISGALLAVVSAILWFTLPIPAMFPPYLVTALLALIYGVVWNCRRGAPLAVKSEVKVEPKPEAAKP
jgi:hypothetical protein